MLKNTVLYSMLWLEADLRLYGAALAWLKFTWNQTRTPFQLANYCVFELNKRLQPVKAEFGLNSMCNLWLILHGCYWQRLKRIR